MKGALLSIDPGKNTGWAYFCDGELFQHGFIKTNEEEIDEVIHDLTEKLKKDITEKAPVCFDAIYIESVGLWLGNERSLSSAVQGHTFLVAYIVGAYTYMLDECNDLVCSVKHIDPRKWKGNMSKEITKRRVERAIGYTVKNEHECDAIGIGLSVLGKL